MEAMEQTIDDMDYENELKCNKIYFSVDGLGFGRKKSRQEMEKLMVTEVFNKKDGVVRRVEKLIKKRKKLILLKINKIGKNRFKFTKIVA